MGGWSCVAVAWSYVGVGPSFGFCFAVAGRGDVPLPRTAPPSTMEAHPHNNTLDLIFCTYARDPTYFTLRAGFNFSSIRDYRKALTELPRSRPIARSSMPCRLPSLNHTRNLVSDKLLRQGEIRSPHEPEPQFIRSPRINKGDANEGNGLHRYCATWMPVRSLTI